MRSMSKKPNAYLKIRGKNNYYSIVINIPNDLRVYYPRASGGVKDKYIKALGTSDIERAKALRDKVAADLFLEFEEFTNPTLKTKLSYAEALEMQLEIMKDAELNDERSLPALERGLDVLRDDYYENPKLYAIDSDHVKLARLKHEAYNTTSITYIVEEYLRAHHAFSLSMKQKMRRYVKELIAFIGRDIPPDSLTSSQARTFISKLNQHPERGHKVKQDTAGGLGKLWSWSKRQELLRDNVFEGAREDIHVDKRGQAKNRYPFSSQDVIDVLDGMHNLSEDKQMLPALTLFGLFSGIRAGELAGLKVEHVLEGHIFDIVAGKNAAAVRRIPTHSALHPLIDKLIETSKDGWLIPHFPEGKTTRGANASSVFSTYKQELWGHNVKPKITYHSFRHRIEDLYRDADVPVAISRYLTGRSGSGSESSYGKGFTIEKMQLAHDSIQQGRQVDEAVTRLVDKLLMA